MKTWRRFYFFPTYWVYYVRSFKNTMSFYTDIWPRVPGASEAGLILQRSILWASQKVPHSLSVDRRCILWGCGVTPLVKYYWKCVQVFAQCKHPFCWWQFITNQIHTVRTPVIPSNGTHLFRHYIQSSYTFMLTSSHLVGDLKKLHTNFFPLVFWTFWSQSWWMIQDIDWHINMLIELPWRQTFATARSLSLLTRVIRTKYT